MPEQRSEEHFDNRLETLAMLVNFMQSRLQKLEEKSDATQKTLTELQISMGRLNEYFERQKSLEEGIDSLNKQMLARGGDFRSLSETVKKVENLVWGLLIALIPGILSMVWELTKHFLGVH